MAVSKESSRRARVQRLAVRNKAFDKVPDEDRAVQQPASIPTSGATWPLDPTMSVSRLILDTVSEGVYCLDLNGCITFVNPAVTAMTGFSSFELIGNLEQESFRASPAKVSLYPDGLCPGDQILQDRLSHHKDDDVFWRKDGSSFPVFCSRTPLVVDGNLVGTVITFQNITERIRQEGWQHSKSSVLQIIAAHHPLRDTLQMLADAYTAYDPASSIAILLRDEMEGDGLVLVAGSRLVEDLDARLRFVSIEGGVTACGEAALSHEEVFIEKRHPGGWTSALVEVAVPFVERCFVLPMISTSGEVLGVAAFFHETASAPASDDLENGEGSASSSKDSPYRNVRDLAQVAVETRKLHSELIHQAQHDQLTGLPNRLLFEHRLTQIIREDAGLNNRRAAVCLIDIDRFRRVNENFGHDIGDGLLREIADRLKRGMRSVDILAREGGDEFLVLLPDIGSAQHAELICRRLLLALAAPFSMQGHSIVVSANIGVCIYPDHAATPELLIQNADTAVDYAKAKGQGKLQIFRPDLGERVRQLAAREAALASALERNEFYLMYQPLYDCYRRLHGFEALLRWNNPELGLIPPDQFIPLAESTGLIVPIGEWVLNEACRQAMAWKPPALKGSKIFVNVSALQLGQVDFTHTVSEALRVSGLAPSRLELEVTESMIVAGFKKATARLQPLQNLGVSIAIDDFGTGHSSFGVLHKLPINAIKVDRSFVARIDRDPSGLSTVRAIVDLARQLGMKTVGEGVETEEQLNLLLEMKCDYFQGYLLSRPLTPEAAHILFEKAPPAAIIPAERLKVSA